VTVSYYTENIFINFILRLVAKAGIEIRPSADYPSTEM